MSKEKTLILLLSVTIAFIFGFVCGGIVITEGNEKALKKGYIYSNKKVYRVKEMDFNDDQNPTP